MKKKVKMIRCEICNKEYSSYSSRSNHIKKYHSEQRIPNVFKCIQMYLNVISTEWY